jgi:chromosome partitioning protein
MAVLTLSSAKGGVGKTTLSVNLAVEFALRGISATVLDCDLNQHASTFGEVFNAANPDIPVRFVAGISKTNLLPAIRKAEADSDIIVIDLPAGTSELSLRAITKSDLVLIPAQRTALDAKDAARTAYQIYEACDVSNKELINSALIWTMVDARFETRTERKVREGLIGMLVAPERAVVPVPLMKYDAFPAGFVHFFVPAQLVGKGGQAMSGIAGGDPFTVPNSVTRAAENMAAIADDVLARLKGIVDGTETGTVSLRAEIIEDLRSTPAMEHV